MEQNQESDQTKFLLADFNTRLRDIDERNRLTRERVLLLGKNLVASRQKNDQELAHIKQEKKALQRDIEEMKRKIKNLTIDNEKYVKRDEIMIIERMLKDFQPLEFMRRNDVTHIVSEKIEELKKQIKSP